MKTSSIIVCYPGELRLEFPVTRDENEPVLELLEWVFSWFNHGSRQESPLFLSRKMRSLSVHDCVCINGQWYQCAGCGWEEISEEYVKELETGVKRHPLFNVHGAFFCLQDLMWTKHKKI